MHNTKFKPPTGASQHRLTTAHGMREVLIHWLLYNDMKRFRTKSIHEEITIFIRNWVELLSNNKFEEALQLLDAPESGSDDIPWNETLLKEAFLDYGAIGRMPVINSPYQMDLATEKIDFYEYDDGSGYFVEYDVPLDGEWGDLTAQFSIKKIGDVFSIKLEDIHVL